VAQRNSENLFLKLTFDELSLANLVVVVEVVRLELFVGHVAGFELNSAIRRVS